MARYRKVSIRLWGDAKVRLLSTPPPNGRDCFMYLMTARESTNIPGLIPAGPAGIAETLRWSADGFLKAFAEVAQVGLAVADWSAGLVWLPKAIHHNEPENPNVVKGWGETWDDLIPECALKLQVYQALRAYCEARGEAFLTAFDESIQRPDVPPEQPLGKGMPNPSERVPETLSPTLPGTLPQTLPPTFGESGTGAGAGTGDLPPRARGTGSGSRKDDTAAPDFASSPAGCFLAWAQEVNPELWRKLPPGDAFRAWYAGAIRELSARGMGDAELRAGYEAFLADPWARTRRPPFAWDAWAAKFLEYLPDGPLGPAAPELVCDACGGGGKYRLEGGFALCLPDWARFESEVGCRPDGTPDPERVKAWVQTQEAA